MKGRIWFSALMAIVGASLLVAASASGGTTASSAASQSTAQKGGTFRILNTSDFDHLDPALAYFTHSWNWMGATQLRMYWYPYVAGAASERIAPMAAQGMPRVSNNGKTLHDHHQAGLQVLERSGSDGRELQAGVRPRA